MRTIKIVKELISDVDARKRKEEGFIEKEALTAVDVLVKKCHKVQSINYTSYFNMRLFYLKTRILSIRKYLLFINSRILELFKFYC